MIQPADLYVQMFFKKNMKKGLTYSGIYVIILMPRGARQGRMDLRAQGAHVRPDKTHKTRGENPTDQTADGSANHN